LLGLETTPTAFFRAGLAMAKGNCTGLAEDAFSRINHIASVGGQHGADWITIPHRHFSAIEE